MGLSMLLGWVPFFIFSLFLYIICWCATHMYYHVVVVVHVNEASSLTAVSESHIKEKLF